MTKEVSTTNTAVAALSPEDQKDLLADRQKMGGNFPSIPLIRLSNKDMTQAPEGEYFVERRGGEQSQVTPIGADPVITILYKTNTYSYYTQDAGLVAWTSDIHGFTALDDVTLFVKNSDKVEVEFEGTYPDFKRFMEEKYTQTDPVTQTKKKLLKFRTVLYVDFQGEVHKMFVSNASAAGVDHEGRPSFGDPQPKSLQSFLDHCWRAKRAGYEFPVKLGSDFVKSSKPFYIMTFLSVGEHDANCLGNAIRMSREVKRGIFAIDAARKSMKGSENPEEETTKPEDLPF